MTTGDRPPDDVLSYLRHIVEWDRDRAHERKNEASARPVRDSLSERMRLAESASDWLRHL